MFFKQKFLNISKNNIIIDIKRSLRLKTTSIKVCKDYIKVKAPFFVSNKKIDELLKKKINWIKKQLIIQKNIQQLIKKSYVNGENFKYLGENFKLQIVKGPKYSVKMEGNLLIVLVKNIENITKVKKLINKWFHEESNSYLKEKTFFYANKNNLKVNSIKVRQYKARWGSCSLNGDITFNWKLIMSPPKIIEYVIIHELMHLKEHNHSSKFWYLVKSHYPNIKDAKNWLIYNEHTLNI